MYFRRRKLDVFACHLVAGTQAAVFMAEQCRQIAAPGGVDVHGKIQSACTASLARSEHTINRVNRAVLGTAEHRYGHQHRLAFACAAIEHRVERVGIEAHATHWQQFQL